MAATALSVRAARQGIRYGRRPVDTWSHGYEPLDTKYAGILQHLDNPGPTTHVAFEVTCTQRLILDCLDGRTLAATQVAEVTGLSTRRVRAVLNDLRRLAAVEPVDATSESGSGGRVWRALAAPPAPAITETLGAWITVNVRTRQSRDALTRAVNVMALQDTWTPERLATELDVSFENARRTLRLMSGLGLATQVSARVNLGRPGGSNPGSSASRWALATRTPDAQAVAA